MSKPYVDLRKPKQCSCGRIHAIAVDPKATAVGVFFECYCQSTLLERVDNWREIVLKEVSRGA